MSLAEKPSGIFSCSQLVNFRTVLPNDDLHEAVVKKAVRVFRSAHLDMCDEASCTRLANEYCIKTIIDLRGKREAAKTIHVREVSPTFDFLTLVS